MATKSKEPEKKEEETDLTLESLQEEVKALRTEAKTKDERTEQERAVTQIQYTVNNQQALHEETKEDDEHHSSIMTEVLARINMNPRLDIQKTYEKVLKAREKTIERRVESKMKKVKDSGRIAARLNIPGIGSGSPIVENQKQWKAEDMQSNASRRALIAALERED